MYSNCCILPNCLSILFYNIFRDFFQILECCNHLVQQQANGKTECSLVTLLVGSRNHLPENATAIAQSIGKRLFLELMRYK